MATPIDKENLRAVLKRIMQSHQLNPQDVKKDMSCWCVFDVGAFECESCLRPWRSHFSWITFDLINLEISKRWKMKCMRCLVVAFPTFTLAQLESMFEKVVKCYKGENELPTKDIGYRGRRNYFMPHRPDLCEKCRWGSDECWTRRIHA